MSRYYCNYCTATSHYHWPYLGLLAAKIGVDASLQLVPVHAVARIDDIGSVARLELLGVHVPHATHPLHLRGEPVPHGEHVEPGLVLVDEEGAVLRAHEEGVGTHEHGTLNEIKVLKGVVVLDKKCDELLVTYHALQTKSEDSHC